MTDTDVYGYCKHGFHRSETAHDCFIKPEPSPRQQGGDGLSEALIAAQAKVIELHQECGDNYCEFHQGKEEEFARECQTCDSIDRLRAAKSELAGLQGGSVFRTVPEAPEPAKASGWVLTSERLPENDDLVLTGHPDGDPMIGYVNEDDGCWYSERAELVPGDLVPTHWMPLPAPPDSEASK
jgi:uncharacterized protein DUF551